MPQNCDTPACGPAGEIPADTQTIVISRGYHFLATFNPDTSGCPTPSLVGVPLKFHIFRRVGTPDLLLITTGTNLSVDNTGKLVRLHVTPTQSTSLPLGTWQWMLERTDTGNEAVLAAGFVCVQMQGGPAPPVNPICPAPIYTPSVGQTFAGTFITGQLPAIAVPCGGPAAIAIPLMTPSGNTAVIQTMGYCVDPNLVAMSGETVSGNPSPSAAGLSDDGMSAIVYLPRCVYETPGIYDVEARGLDATGAVRARGRAIAYVEPSGFGRWNAGPPPIDDIRGQMRDYPNANRLIGTYEFSVTEIAYAVARAVRNFNATPPPSTWLITTSTWPRVMWANLFDAVAANLFEVAAAYNRVNHLPYSAGAVSVDDFGREKDYQAAANILRARWEQWVKVTKMGINMEAGFGSVLSGYSNWYADGYYGNGW